MNITDNLIRIKQGKDDIIKSLKNKGVSINDNTLINEIPTIIDNAEIGGGGDTPIQPDIPELVPKYDGATVFRINVPTDNYEFGFKLSSNYNSGYYNLDWGDGSLELERFSVSNEQHHTYSKSGVYDINIYNLSNNIEFGGQEQKSAKTFLTYYYITYVPTKISYIDGNYINNNDYIITDIIIGDRITKLAIDSCNSQSKLKTIIIPDGVTAINTRSFRNCSSLTSINIPDSVTTIISYGFESCSNLQSITIGNSVTTINSSAFSGCTNLQSITCKAMTAPTIQIASFPTSGFYYSKRYLYVPKESIGYDSGNWKTYLIDKGWELRYIEDKPEKVPTTLSYRLIGDYDFSIEKLFNSNLIKTEINDNITTLLFDDRIIELPKYTFVTANKITYIDIPNTVEYIADNFGTLSSDSTLICRAMVAPTITQKTFNIQPKKLIIPKDSVGYEEEGSLWKTYLIDKGCIVEYI